MAKPKQPSSWRDRIIGFERIPAKELQSHTGNWRTHPQFQQDALLGTLREIGIAGALLVYRSPAQDGALVTIDGHLRKALDGEQDWPCLILDVDDDEAAYILATHDPIASFAQANTEQLQRLLSSVQSGEAGVQALLSELAEQHGLIPVDPTVPGEPGASVEHASLVDRFGVPPFSVLDARQGYWQARKQAWLALGIQSELGRGGGLTIQDANLSDEGMNHYRNVTNATPGGSPMPAGKLGPDGKTVRGDGGRRPM